MNRPAPPEKFRFRIAADGKKVDIAGFGESGTVSLKNCTGLKDIHLLLSRPGDQIPLQLFASQHRYRNHEKSITQSALQADGLSIIADSGLNATDQDTISSINERIRELNRLKQRYTQEIIKATNDGNNVDAQDSERLLQKTQKELDEVQDYLSKCAGLNGKPRICNSPIESKRKALGTRLRRAYKCQAELGLRQVAQHLAESISAPSTGGCCYHPKKQPNWEIV